jgi:hypothetical protein
MIQLLDTALGFVAIMAMLSLLVKCLTSLVKSYVDYYSGNLRSEVDSLLQGMLGRGITALARTSPWLNDINWKSLGEEYLTVDKMRVLLQQLDPTWVDMGDLQTRVDLHIANLRYDFERKMKNLALAAGLAICLLCNINSVAIWKTLYTDQQLRSTFATQYSQKALEFADSAAKLEKGSPQKPDAAGGSSPAQNATTGAPAPSAGTAVPANPPTREDLAKQSQALRGNVETFLADVNFGVGRVWRQKYPEIQAGGFCYEFLGSLLTGILISIGAPYWHDLLRTLSSLRKPASS